MKRYGSQMNKIVLPNHEDNQITLLYAVIYRNSLSYECYWLYPHIQWRMDMSEIKMLEQSLFLPLSTQLTQGTPQFSWVCCKFSCHSLGVLPSIEREGVVCSMMCPNNWPHFLPHDHQHLCPPQYFPRISDGQKLALSFLQQGDAMYHTSNQALKDIKFLWRKDYLEGTLATPIYRHDSAEFLPVDSAEGQSF
jgi:hypothetical protein